MATYQLTQTGAQVQADLDAVEAGDIVYLTSAPSADNTSGKLKIVVLDVEPTTKYDGYIYIIKGNTSITDLTGTKWRFNDTITATAGYGIFDLYAEDIENGGVWSKLYVGYKFSASSPLHPTPADNAVVWMRHIVPPAGEFTITGGNDVTNTNLISWLQANATQVSANQVSLISFTIVGTQYQAEQGMTWAQWVNSNYNTSGYMESTIYILDNGGTWAISLNDNYIQKTDTIVANTGYGWKAYNNGGGK